MSNNIDIRVREDGSRVVSRSLDELAAKADKAGAAVETMNKRIKSSSGNGTALTKLQNLIKLAESYGAGMVRNLKAQEEAELKSSADRLKLSSQIIATKMKAESEYTAWWSAELAKRDSAQAASALRNAEQHSKMQAFNPSRLNSMIAPAQGTSELSKFYAAQSSGNIGGKTALQTAEVQAMQRQMAMMQLLLPMAERQVMLDNEAEASAKRLASAKGTLNNAHNNLAQSSKSSAANQEYWNKAASDGHAFARGLSGSLGHLWMTYGSLVPLLAGAALGSSFLSAAKAGSELQYSLQFVKSLGGESQEAIDKLRASALELSKGSQYSPTEISNGYRILAQAGLDAAASLKVMPDVLALATTGEMTMEQAGLALVGVMNAFNLTTKDSGHIGDVFAKAAAVSQTSVSQMTEAMKTASTVGQQYHQSMEGTATALALLAKLNITGTAAGTSFRNMLKELYTPTEKVGEEMKKLGIRTEEVVIDQFGKSTKKVRDFADVVYDLKKKMETLNEPSQMRLTQFLGNERGAKELVVMLNMSREEWDKFYNEIANKSKGFNKKIQGDLNNAVQGQWKIALNTLQSTLIETFNSMAPEFMQLAKSLREVFASDEFTSAVRNVVSLILQITNKLIENLPVIIEVGKAWLVLKAAMVTMAVVEAGIMAFTTLTKAMAGAQLAMQTFSAVAAGTATTLGGGSGLVAALGMLGNPLTIMLSLLAAGATAWMLWGNQSKEAMDKAAAAAASASANIANMLEQQQAGMRLNSISWNLAATKAIKAKADVEKQIQESLNGANENVNFGYRFHNGMVFDSQNRDVTASLENGKGWAKDVGNLLKTYKSLTGDINTANENMKDAVAAEKKAQEALQVKPVIPKTGKGEWNPPKKDKGGSGPSGRLTQDENALAKLQASLQAAEKEYAVIMMTGDAQYKLNVGQEKALEIQNKINELEAKSLAGLKEKGLAGRALQLKNLYDELEVAKKLGDQLQANGLLKVSKKMEEEVRMAQLVPLEREKETKWLTYRNELLANGGIIDRTIENNLKSQINNQIELNKVIAQRDQLLQNSDAQKKKDFNTKLQGFEEAKTKPGWTENDTSKFGLSQVQGMGLDVSGTDQYKQTQLEQINQYYQQLEQLRQADLIQEQTYQNAKAQLAAQTTQIQLSTMSSFFGTLAGLQNSGNKKLGAIGKAAAITQATMDGVVAVQKAYTGGVYPWNIAMAAAQGAIAAANVAKIAGLNFATGGSFIVPGTGGVDTANVAFRASPGEKVTVSTPTQVRKGTNAVNGDGAAAQPTVVTPKIINVLDPSIVGDYLGTDDGEQLIMNVVQRNQRALGY